MAEVPQKLIDIIVEQLQVDEDEVTPETTFVDDLGCDSLDKVEIIMEVEEVWDIEISDAEAEDVVTVQQAADMIDRLKNC